MRNRAYKSKSGYERDSESYWDVIFNKASLDTNTPLCLAKIEVHKMD